MEKNTSIKIKNFLRVCNELDNFLSISNQERVIVFLVMKYWNKNIKPSVSDLVKNNDSISSRSAHRYIKKLIEEKWLIIKPNPSDKREKYIIPSKPLITVFAQACS